MNNQSSRQLSRVAGILVSAITMALCAISSDASAATPCELTAQRMQLSCTRVARAEYFRSYAIALNISDAGERNQAILDTVAAFDEAIEECRDQLEARADLCDALDEWKYDPEIDPADFSAPVQNPYFPLVPGMIRTYEGETDEGTETVIVEVTNETREILGVECFVVLDRVFLDGEEIENTRDYYVPDNFGNVWYFGENSVEIEDGLIVNTEGSFIAGEDGAKPGIIMPAAPAVGETYRQEWALGEAEDWAAIVSLNEMVTVPFGMFNNCVQTIDGTPLDPDAVEFKFYAAGIGPVLEVNAESGEAVELIDVTP